MPTEPNACPLCWATMDVAFVDRGGENSILKCANCGEHKLSDSAVGILIPGRRFSATDRARMAFGIRRVDRSVLLTSSLVEDIARETKLPPAMERIDNLVLHLAETLAPGERTTLTPHQLRAVVGAESDEAVQWVLEEALQLRYIVGSTPQIYPPGGWAVKEATMVLPGWQRHAELMRDGAGSTHAFMAMKFGEPELEQVFLEVMVPEVAKTGFQLRTVAGSHQSAGSIDDRMRVEIRTSRFMVCDLTHGNQGAYWEAGFAEGIGRKVIYTCRADVLKGQHSTKVHFDTAHQLIIPWDVEDLPTFATKLKNAIRATLPAEAKMRDD